jgi:hypothetical protein
LALPKIQESTERIRGHSDKLLDGFRTAALWLEEKGF